MDVKQLRFMGPSALVIGGAASETFGPGTLLTPFSDTQVRSLLQGVTLAPIPEAWLRTHGIMEWLSEQSGQTVQVTRSADGQHIQHLGISADTREQMLADGRAKFSRYQAAQQAKAAAEAALETERAEAAAAAEARRAFTERPKCPASITLTRLDAAAEATDYLKRTKAPRPCAGGIDGAWRRLRWRCRGAGD